MVLLELVEPEYVEVLWVAVDAGGARPLGHVGPVAGDASALHHSDWPVGELVDFDILRD